MKVYIASKYLAHESINNKIYNALLEADIDAFLPKSINIDAVSAEEMLLVGEKCYDELDKCDVIIAVEPYGNSVSSEIGYARCQRRRLQKNKRIILFSNTLDNGATKSEAMITPFFDTKVSSIQELVKYLKEAMDY